MNNKSWWALAILVLVLSLYAANAKSQAVGVMVGHWGYHWLSEDVTNEEHRLVCLRVNYIQGCSFRNSYRQPGFSGESYSLGFVHDLPVWPNLNRWGGDIVVKASIGATYGYTTFAGHDGSDKDIHGYIAGGPFYQQPIDGTRASWEAGVLQFGDDSVPSAGIFWSF